MKFAHIAADPPLVLAPMAGYTDYVYRRICKRHGAGLLITELISSHALVYQNQKTFQMLRWDDEDRPIGVQLFGGEPEVMARAAKLVAEYEPDFIDINLGCSVPKVVKTGAGAALTRDPELVKAVVGAVAEAVKLPVTVKMRKSWDSTENPGPEEIARAAVEAGARAIAIHPRTAKQGFSGEADWKAIRRVKEAVSVPIIGSGDVKIPQDALRMFEETGCDAVMIGRAALGNPWVFERTAEFLKTGLVPPKPEIADRVNAAIEHATAMVAFRGEDRALHDFRAHIGWYLKGLPGASPVRTKAIHCTALSDLVSILAQYQEANLEASR